MFVRILIFLLVVFSFKVLAQAPFAKDPSACKGAHKEVYLTWISEETLYFLRSLDGGITWLPDAKFINKVKNAENYLVDGITVKGKPVITCDTSMSAFRGRIYISWSDEKYGATNKDVFIVYSDDKGENWTEPILVTYRPNHREQFKPALSVDQKTGRLCVIYFDKQNYLEPGLADVYMALSSNGGLKFEYYKLNEQAVKLEAKNTLVNSAIYETSGNSFANWTNLDSEKKLITIQTTINDTLINRYNRLNAATEARVEKSFSYAAKIKIGIGFNDAMTLNATITKPLEPGFEKVVVRNQKCAKGVTSLLIDTKRLGLPKGNYILTLYYGKKNSFVWITE
jgi:hypothetical protein